MLTLVTLGCSERSRSLRSTTDAWWQGGQPDELPQMLNDALPFQYPVAQYLRRMQGNVTLRLFVDASGAVVPDSTRIEKPSGVQAFDSAALAGAPRLRFRPARRGGTAIPVALLYPVHFRHPEGGAAPADSL
jgi:TonB family protein